MRAQRRGRPQGGFTLMEIMIALLVLVIGTLGVVALQMTTMKGNRSSRELDRAVDLVTQLMEDLRGISTTTIAGGALCSTCSAWHYPDITSADGVTYTRTYALSSVSGQATLVLVTATVSYPDDHDSSIVHTQTMQMVRTTVETL